MDIKFKRVHSLKDLILSISTLIIGIGLYFVNQIAGILFIAIGVLMIIFFKTCYKKEGENVFFFKKALDVDHSCRESLMAFLEGQKVEPQVVETEDGGAIRLEIYYNATASIAFVQLFDFSNYKYEPATQIIDLRGVRADAIIKKI